MDKKKIALIVVVLFLLIGLGSFVFANPDQDNNLEGPGVSEDGGSGDGEVIDGTEPTATPEEENDDSATETDPITTYGNGGNGTGTGAGNDGTTGGVGNTDMSMYDDARKIIEELENRVNSMKSKNDSNDAIDYRTDTDIIDMVNNLPDGTVKDELKDRLDAINKVLDDTSAPVITGINNNDVTKENVTINVTDDNDVTITATLDGEKIEFTTPLTEEGHYVVTVTDKNFNTTTVEFTIDKNPIALDWLYVLNNSGTDYKVIGDGQKLYVELVFSEEFTSTPMIQIGNAEAVEMACHWTNWQTEKQYFKCDATITIDGSTMGLENGKEVPVKITNVLDAAGNETVLTNENITETEKYGHVIYDKQAPEYAAMGIFNWTNDNDGTDRTYATKNEHIRLYVSFPEMLATNPKVDIYGMDGKVTTLDLSYSEAAKFYFVEFDTTEEFALPEGKINFKVYGYADEAGNVGVELTQDMATSKKYPHVIYDSIAPVLNYSNGFITDEFTVVATDDNFDYMTIQYFDGREMKTITENTFTLDAEGDNVRYNIKAYDKAGNVSVYADIYLDNKAPGLSGTGVNGKKEVKVKDGGYYKNATIHFEDGSLKKVVFVNEDGTEELLEEYDDNFKNIKLVFNRAFSEDGVYTLKAVDRKGNETKVTFTIDTIKPVITGVENGAITNQNVTLNVTDENPGGTIHLKRNGQIIKNYSFGNAITEDGNYEVYVSDLAGNVSETIKFTIDQTDPVVKAANILVDGDVNEQTEFYATKGDTIYSYVRFSEELKQNPKFYLINNGTEYEVSDVTVTGPNDNGEYTYSIRYTITEDTTMVDGQIEMKVTGISDKAGNTIDDITKPTNGHIVHLDRVAPNKQSLRLTNISRKDENGAWLQVAKAGDSVRVIVQFDENLTTLPTLKVNGTKVGVMKYDSNMQSYTYDYKVTENDVNGIMQIEISNYADAAGNVRDTLTNKDINHDTQNQVVIDTVAPKLDIKTLTNGYSNSRSLSVSGADANKLSVVITNAEGTVVCFDSSSQGSDGTYWTAYDIENEISVDGQYTAVASDVAGNKTTVTFTVDREAPKFDLSAIPTTFTIGKDIYQYPQPGIVTDNIDGNISFGEVHMNWYHKNADGTKGEATQCFGGDNWNTSLTNCEPGDYIITYRVSDKAGNETSVKKTMTLVKEVVDNKPPIIKGVETNNNYSETRTLEIYDNSGFVTIYFDYDNGYTSPTELRENVKPLNKINATEDKPWSIQIPAAKGLSVYVVDEAGKEAFVTRVTIGQ